MKRANVLIIIFIAVVLLVLTAVLLACTVFIVRHVEVESEVSSSILDEQAIIDASEIEKGKSIIAVNKEKVKASIEKENPYVEVNFIERVFPNTILIKVTVRSAIMSMLSEDGANLAILDADLKVLEMWQGDASEDSAVTFVKGATFVPGEEGADSLVGTYLDREENAVFTLLYDIARASADPNVDYAGKSFSTFFKEIEIISYEKGLYAYILTNTGVRLVIDTGLSIDVYNQLSLCMFVYNSEEMDVDKTSGYIRNPDAVAYRWYPTLE